MSKGREKQAQVIFTPSGKRGYFDFGTTLLSCARALGVDLDSVCGGRGICGRCQVSIGRGEFAKHAIVSGADHLEPLTGTEQQYSERKGLAEGMRLACHSRLAGDVLVDVPPSGQIHRQIVRKRADTREIEVDPDIRLHFVHVDEPDIETPIGDFERLARAVKSQWDINVKSMDHSVLCDLQNVMREGNWKVTVAVLRGGQVIRIWPGFHERACGVAIDMGSTTIAAHLCDLASGDVLGSSGIMNPQIRFGEDVMSRVSYAMLNEGGALELTSEIRQGISSAIKKAAEAADIDETDILAISVVGNPIMHHLLLGLDPIPLGVAPFALGVSSALNFQAAELGIDHVNKNTRVYVLPCIAGHVGADASAMVLSEGPHLRKEISLLIDVGTNAEIILGNKDRLLAVSSPTGPAFEGAQISNGQRAAKGAIERVRIDLDTLKPRFRVIGCDLWSDEAGFSDATADSGVTGICGSGIIEAIGEMYLAGILSPDGVINGALTNKTDRVVAHGRSFSFVLHKGTLEITITQNDVRAIQLAKAALLAGARLLMDYLSVTHIDRIILAGAFGSYIDAKYAMIIGMIPDCDLQAVSSAGNAAGTGARIALLNRAARAEIEEVVKNIEKIESAVEPRFQEYFIEAMAIPHDGPEKPRKRRSRRRHP